MFLEVVDYRQKADTRIVKINNFFFQINSIKLRILRTNILETNLKLKPLLKIKQKIIKLTTPIAQFEQKIGRQIFDFSRD